MRICDDSGNEFRTTGRSHLARPLHRVIPPRLVPAAEPHPLLAPRQGGLELLVQHPLHGALHDAQVARAHALVQAADPLVAHNLPDAVGAVAVLAVRRGGALAGLLERRVLVQLQTRLDHPDGVRRGARGHAGGDARREVHPCGLLPAVPVLGHEPLAIAVDVEADAARGHDADEVRAETLKQGPGPFGPVDGAQDLQGVGEVVDGGADGVEGVVVGDAGGSAGGSDLGLVEVGLQTGLEDVEGRCHGCGRHASDAVERCEHSLGLFLRISSRANSPSSHEVNP